MLKVLHLTTHVNIGGITSYIELLTNEMRKMGYQFWVASSGGSQCDALTRNGVTCEILNLRTKNELSPKVYANIKPLINLIRREQIDLIHAHTRVTQVLAWWIRKLIGIPVVTTCHGFYKRRLGRLLLPAWGDHAIAISEPVMDSLIDRFRVGKERTSTIFNAIDVANLRSRYGEKNPSQIRQELNIPEGCPTIGIVARVVEDKGHEFFLRAAAKLIKEFDRDIHVVVVGDGPYMKQVNALARALGIEQSVRCLGTISDVTYALCVMDIFILPALWREGFGLSIIEAMAVKKPVIVTNIWALNSLIKNRVNGILVPPKDLDRLAGAIQEVIVNQELRNEIAENGCRMVEEQFSIEMMAEHVDELYRSIVAKGALCSKDSK